MTNTLAPHAGQQDDSPEIIVALGDGKGNAIKIYWIADGSKVDITPMGAGEVNDGD